MNGELRVTLGIDDWSLSLSVRATEFLDVLAVLLPKSELAGPIRAKLEELRRQITEAGRP